MRPPIPAPTPSCGGTFRAGHRPGHRQRGAFHGHCSPVSRDELLICSILCILLDGVRICSILLDVC